MIDNKLLGSLINGISPEDALPKMAFLTFCHVAFFCNLITKWVNIHLGPGVKYAGFALFFVVVCFLSLKAYYFKFDKTTEPWGTFFSWRHFGMDHQCISLAFSPKHIWIYWIQLNTVSLIDITVHFFFITYIEISEILIVILQNKN